MTQTCKAVTEVKQQQQQQSNKTKYSEKQQENSMHETQMKRKLVWNHFCDNTGLNSPNVSYGVCLPEQSNGTHKSASWCWLL